MRIAAISSRKPGHINEGVLKNDYQYQGAYSDMDEDIGWNDFEYRSYDAQIGRWLQIDPLDKYTSPYSGMDNDPINNVDPNGAAAIGPVPWPVLQSVIFPALNYTIWYTTKAISTTTSTVSVSTKIGVGLGKVAKHTASGASVVLKTTTVNATLNKSGATLPPYLQNPGKLPAKLDPRFKFDPGVTSEKLTQTSILTLNYVMGQMNVKVLTISSTGRSPEKQAYILFDQMKSGHPIRYRTHGERVKAVYTKMKKAGASDAEIKEEMIKEVYKQGPGKVSGHCADPKVQNAIDFGIKGIGRNLNAEQKEKFRNLLQGMKDKGWLSRFITPEIDPNEKAFHIQIPTHDAELGTGNPAQSSNTAPWKNFGVQRTNWVSWP